MSSFSALIRAASMRVRTASADMSGSAAVAGSAVAPAASRGAGGDVSRIDLRHMRVQHAAVGEIPPHAQFRIVELSPIGLLATDDA